jgi:ParB family chromosome partitioning protein
MVLKVFYNAYTIDTCLEIQTRTSSPDRSIDGLAEFAPAAAILRRKEAWAEQLLRQPKALWDYLLGLDGDSRANLFALCAGLSVNAMQEFHNRRPDAIAHGRRLAEFVGLDMAQHWEPTAANFFSRVTKGRILNAVREAKGEALAQLIDHLKRADMAKEAERLLAGSGWLPQPLRTPGRDRAALPIAEGATPETEASASSASAPVAPGAEALPAFLARDDEPAGEGRAPELAKAFANEAFDPGPDLDTFEEGLEPDVKAVALARAGQALDDDHFGIAAE